MQSRITIRFFLESLEQVKRGGRLDALMPVLGVLLRKAAVSRFTRTLGTLLKIDHRQGSELVTRYNLYPAASMFGAPRPGTSFSGLSSAMRSSVRGQSWK